MGSSADLAISLFRIFWPFWQFLLFFIGFWVFWPILHHFSDSGHFGHSGYFSHCSNLGQTNISEFRNYFPESEQKLLKSEFTVNAIGKHRVKKMSEKNHLRGSFCFHSLKKMTQHSLEETIKYFRDENETRREI